MLFLKFCYNLSWFRKNTYWEEAHKHILCVLSNLIILYSLSRMVLAGRKLSNNISICVFFFNFTLIVGFMITIYIILYSLEQMTR